MQKKRNLSFTLVLLVLMTSLTTSCEEIPKTECRPAAIWPDSCAWDWYMDTGEATKLGKPLPPRPQCVQSDMDKRIRQQEIIERNCK